MATKHRKGTASRKTTRRSYKRKQNNHILLIAGAVLLIGTLYVMVINRPFDFTMITPSMVLVAITLVNLVIPSTIVRIVTLVTAAYIAFPF